MVRHYLETLLLLPLLVACHSQESIGIFPAWQEGELEIHQIYTGRGESSFLILPDGTTMLIDVGDYAPKDYPKMGELLPDTSRRAGEWIARYVQRVNPHKDQVDYLVISHFHSDHIGDAKNAAPHTTGRHPDYVLTGIAEAGESLRFGKVFDRGYPDYAYPLPVQDRDVDNYRAFLQWQQEQYGTRQERFEVGRLNQIHLLNDSSRYGNNFTIRNLAANGEIWNPETGRTLKTYDLNQKNLDPAQQNENTKSLALRIDYGPFSYYTGGDLSANVYDETGNLLNVEEQVGQACGEVDVCKVNHHAWKDAMSGGFIRNVRAKQYVIPVWEDEHIQPFILERMLDKSLYQGQRLIFPTYMPDHLRGLYASRRWMSSVCPENGHIVVKVFEGGRKYAVYVVSAEDESGQVKAVYGPFDSRTSLTESVFEKPETDRLQVAIIPDRSDYDYHVGEEVRFLIEVSRRGELVPDSRIDYMVGPECFPTVSKQNVLLKNGRGVIQAVMSKPGFLRCEVHARTTDGAECRQMATVAVDKDRINAIVQLPTDWGRFWQEAIILAQRTELAPHLQRAPEMDTSGQKAYRVDFGNNRDGSRMYGVLAIPKGQEGRKYAAILQLPGAGVHRFETIADYGDSLITLSLGIHGIPQDLPEELYKDLAEGSLHDYARMNVTDRDAFYYKRVYIGCIRAIDFLYTLPEFDGQTVGVCGGSQGGGLSMAVAALDKRVRFLTVYFPALCDQQAWTEERADGWPHTFREAAYADPQLKKLAAQALSYYDIVNFASQIRVPGWYCTGYNDTVCPPTSVMAAYNRISAEKQLHIMPDAGHWGYSRQETLRRQWIKSQVERLRGE